MIRTTAWRLALVMLLGLLGTASSYATKQSLPIEYECWATNSSAVVSLHFDAQASHLKVTASGVSGLAMAPVLVTRDAVKAGETVRLNLAYQLGEGPAAVALHVEGQFYGVNAAENRSFAVSPGKMTSFKVDTGKIKLVPANVTRP